MVRRGYYIQNPLKDVPPLAENTIIPFVFSPEQIEQLLSAVCKRLRKSQNCFLTDLAKYLAIVRALGPMWNENKRAFAAFA